MTLNTSSKQGEPTPSAPLLRIEADGETAFVKLSDGVSMPLLDLRGRHSCVYLSLNGKKYIMLANDKDESVVLCFQPKHNGQHQLCVTPENAELDYLHLVDQLTGADVDLLLNPCYTFEADYDNDYDRFRLVFNVIPN